MLWTIFVILVVLWLLGMVSSYTMGGLIHILLVVAVVVLHLQPRLRETRPLADSPATKSGRRSPPAGLSSHRTTAGIRQKEAL